jgi:hypothetical protein
MIVYNYAVWGRGRFPVAMLSRDRCWPRLEGEAAKVATHGATLLGERQVHLQGLQAPTRDLWAAFDWEVGEEIRTVQV